MQRSYRPIRRLHEYCHDMNSHIVHIHLSDFVRMCLYFVPSPLAFFPHPHMPSSYHSMHLFCCISTSLYPAYLCQYFSPLPMYSQRFFKRPARRPQRAPKYTQAPVFFGRKGSKYNALLVSDICAILSSRIHPKANAHDGARYRHTTFTARLHAILPLMQARCRWLSNTRATQDEIVPGHVAKSHVRPRSRDRIATPCDPGHPAKSSHLSMYEMSCSPPPPPPLQWS